MLAHVLGDLCTPPDDEWAAIANVQMQDEAALLNLIRRYVVPAYEKFDSASRSKVRDSLAYFIGVPNSGIDSIFATYQVPIQPSESALTFFKLVWSELFDEPVPVALDASTFERDESAEFANSVRLRPESASNNCAHPS
jgi:hypothetical protein